MKMSLI